MRVKTSALPFAAAVAYAAALAAALACAGCSASDSLRPPVQGLTLSRMRSGPSVSLCASGGSLYAVFSEWDSGTIVVSEIPLGLRLPDTAPAPAVVDRVQAGPALSGSLGLHAAAAFGEAVHVLYLDRRREDRRILKSLTRSSDGRWEVDPLVPPGEPVAVLPDTSGQPVAFWAAGSLLSRPLEQAVETRVLRTPFIPAGPGSPAGSAFTVYDTASRALLLVTADFGRWTVSEVPGGRPVHCATLTPAGGVAVATYDPDTLRVRLLEQPSAGSQWKAVTVTVSRGMRFLHAAPRGGSYVFLYDGVEAPQGGGTRYGLWLLSRKGGRYQRSVVWEGRTSLAGAAALVIGDAAYILTASEEVRLLRVAIP